ncbi:hypothetical protein HK097_004338 [Rhizophlyctis rosea]|uniref:Uncharacterized protein n=1 Tax=Rhizophlyctis rosea TaxID=64517 RepID=A0AAD5X906_9FUNG|nr:hypothetical protein HK097_004338 [Rhizophlyctis rosea]
MSVTYTSPQQSVHIYRSDDWDIPHVIVYGFGLSARSVGEIGVWRNVDYFDASTNLLTAAYTTRNSTENDIVSFANDSTVILELVEQNVRKYGSALFVSVGFRSEKDTLPQISEIINESGYFLGRVDREAAHPNVVAMGFRVNSEPYTWLVENHLQCIRGYQCPSDFASKVAITQTNNFNTYHNLTDWVISENDYRYFCYISMRDDILYTPQSTRRGPKPAREKGKITIGVAMPTLSLTPTYLEAPPLSIFMPSFFETITAEEAKKFQYIVYIGYDEGDVFFDDPSTLSQIDLKLREMTEAHPKKISVQFQYSRFPYTRGWVTYFWNGLFAQAMADGCDYFYQVNDDLKLVSGGWTTKFVDVMVQNDGFGVTGPYDSRLPDRQLLTQAFASRVHYDIFGRFYLVAIKDWFSDDWLTTVYGPPNTHILTEVFVQNVNPHGTRYQGCYQPRMPEFLKEGERLIEEWKARQGKGITQIADDRDE